MGERTRRYKKRILMKREWRRKREESEREVKNRK
jgi:hypothetical protein